MSTITTLEQTPVNNSTAMSGNGDINSQLVDIVKRNAHRKAENGSQFSSTKGKASLLSACIDEARSFLGLSKFDETGSKTQLPGEVFTALKATVDRFWFNEAQNIVQRAIDNDARITVRTGILMSKVGKGNKIVRSKTDRLTSVYNPSATEHKFCDLVGLNSAKARLDQMLDNVGKHSRDELDEQRKKIEILEKAVNSHK